MLINKHGYKHYYYIVIIFYCYIVILLYCSIVLLLYCYIIILLYCYIAILLYYYTIILLYCYIIILSYCFNIILLYCYIIILLYSWYRLHFEYAYHFWAWNSACREVLWLESGKPMSYHFQYVQLPLNLCWQTLEACKIVACETSKHLQNESIYIHTYISI